ncbi:LacI family DNA-binding transcriptional regulator [Sphingobium sp. Sx8-8]|uniref:LacI family DNA-binding transcriptional regulator n=1 Tax=Sphingobium sp. Sx8-8 TaxID=2933617 RepID=UPI001F5A7F34|nr:LacI family DNA-binding transcriptional regulator [Sphingobium sp. Sx8-8]
MKTPPRPVTLADVGAKAGVSAKTVSRVVNRHPEVTPATRQRVEAAIAATGFKPNMAARSLATDRSFLIGCFIVNSHNFYYAELVRGAARASRRYGFHLVLEEIDADESVADYYHEKMRNIGYHGLILPPHYCDSAALLDALEEDGQRYVRISPAIDPDRSPSIYADDGQGVSELAEHLWRLGHRRFGVLAGPVGHLASTIRCDGFVQSLVRLGCSSSDIRIERPASWNSIAMAGRDVAERLLRTGERPTAIFCYNDELAAALIGYARDMNLSIPHDLAVAGFDDSETARLNWPPLTTVHQPIVEMAERAVGWLVSPEPSGQTICPVALKIRSSTDPDAVFIPE